jgi:hypothetical protein
MISSLLQGRHLPFSPSPLRLNILRLFVILSLTQLASPTLGQHISTFRGYRFYFLSETLKKIASPIIFLFMHNHLTLRKWCYTPLQRDHNSKTSFKKKEKLV